MIDIQLLLVTMVELFAFIIVGWIITKLGICDAHGNKVISSLVSNVLSPALIISAVQAETTESVDQYVWEALLYGVLLYGFFLLFALISTLWLSKEERPIHKMLLIFSNTAFVGYPLLRALFGEFSVFVFSLMHMSFNVLIFSYGVYLLKKGQQGKGFSLKNIITPGLLSSVIAIFLYFTDIKLPAPAVDFFTTLGEASIPLSMIAVGASVAMRPLRGIFEDNHLMLMTAIKLIALPCVIAFVTIWLPCSEFTRQLLIISGTLPGGTMTVILATEYQGNTKTAASGVVLSTLCSIITIPLLLQMLL